jgi:hypothetical protein
MKWKNPSATPEEYEDIPDILKFDVPASYA